MRAFLPFALVLWPLVCDAQAPLPAKSIAALVAEQRARDAESASNMAAHGQLLYDADANKKSWGQYCADSQRLSDQGEFRRAIRQASKALFLGEREHNSVALAYAMRDLAYAYSFAGDIERSHEWATKSLSASRAINNPNVNTGNEVVAPVEKILGDIAARRGSHEEALGHYLAALEAASMFSSQKSAIRIAIASAELRRGQPARARALLAKEIDGTDALAAVARRGMGEAAIVMRDWDEAKTQFRRAVDSAKTAKSDYAEMWAHYGLARAQQADGERDAASESLARAIEKAEGLRGAFQATEFKSGFFAEVQEIFDHAIDAAAASGDARRALHLSEQGRARAALDMIRNRTQSGSQASQATRARDPAEVATALPEGVVLVVYHVFSHATLAWTVRRLGVEMKRLKPGTRDLERAIVQLREHIVVNSSLASQDARALHAALIEPLGLRPGEVVVFIPHRSLHVAPLHALRDDSGPLIGRNAVAYALSVSAAGDSLLRALASTGGLFALGNPDLGDPQFDLPAAEDEVRAIARLAGGAAPLVRKEASAARFRAGSPGAGIVHVAAHATVDEVDPLYSAVKLAAGDVEAREIYDMDLRAAGLVALSACSSGLGRVSGGDEFWGFKRSFLVAGARALLVSLWPVADESTGRLMQSFYRHRQQMGAAEALRRAQLELLATAQDSAPVFWAPFVLVGDWR